MSTVGIKSRGVYETPGGTILWKAHLDLEGICLDKFVFRLQEYLGGQFADACYNGMWYSPEMGVIRAAIAKTQELVRACTLLLLAWT
jgi:argininosuccinate synthase